ncbi:MAG: DUF202 domain-containing protein [Ignavibacteria bacterium]|nr:DUF202 domain-containing protein [Ignavibacteria bacterium]
MLKFLRTNVFTDDLYKKFIDKNLNLNDQLAAVRSILACERTFLSYLRTSIAILAAGVTFIQFFQIFWIHLVGWFLLPTSIVVVFLGWKRFRKTRTYIYQIEKDFANRTK